VMGEQTKADVVVSLDSDFLSSGPGHVRYARDFSSRRAMQGPASQLNRLYVVESMPTNTGAMADHRFPMRADNVKFSAHFLAAALKVPGLVAEPNREPWTAIARDLERHRGGSLVIAGEEQPPLVHALAHAMNEVLGNVGQTVYYTEPLEADPVNGIESLRELVGDLNAGKVEALVILGGNPVYDVPADFEFGPALVKAKLRVHSGLYYDETGSGTWTILDTGGRMLPEVPRPVWAEKK